MRLKSIHLAVLTLLLMSAAVNPVNATEKGGAKDKVVATVNNVAIPQERFELELKSITQQGQADSPELRSKIKEELIDLELLSQEARKKGLDKQPEVAQMLEITRQKILRNAFMQDYAKNHPIAEEKLKQIYENQKQAMAGKKEYKIAHILVDSEKEALAIAASLKNKGKFEKIAKEKSKDQGSKAQGGDLGWRNPASFSPPFAGALTKLTKGQISAPVQTQFGWHLIKLAEVRDIRIPPYDEAKVILEKRLQQGAIREAARALRDSAKIN